MKRTKMSMYANWYDELKAEYDIDWLDKNTALSAVPGRGEPFFGKFDKEDIDNALKLLMKEGIGFVVTLMEQKELDGLGIGDLGERFRECGIGWVHFPIRDRSTPKKSVAGLIKRINDEIAAGRKVLIHCRGGYGRTGTIAGCYLASNGYKPSKILEMLHDARGSICPETPAQVKFILNFGKTQCQDLPSNTNGL